MTREGYDKRWPRRIERAVVVIIVVVVVVVMVIKRITPPGIEPGIKKKGIEPGIKIKEKGIRWMSVRRTISPPGARTRVGKRKRKRHPLDERPPQP